MFILQVEKPEKSSYTLVNKTLISKEWFNLLRFTNKGFNATQENRNLQIFMGLFK